MFGKSELEGRIKELERKVMYLEKERELVWEVVNAKYKNVENIIERYVQEHIWYTNVENLEAFEKGSKIRIVLRDLNEILGNAPKRSRADTAKYALDKPKKTVKSKKKEKEIE